MASRREIAGFFALSWLLLLLVPGLHALLGSGPMDFAAAAERATAETGLPWTSSLPVVIRLSVAEPMLALLLLGAAVPSLAAILLVARDPARLRRLLARFAPVGAGVPFRRAASSYALASLLLVACLLATLAIRAAVDVPVATPRAADLLGAALAPLLLAVLAAALLDQGAVLEELGWRGFAFPALQQGHASPLAAAVLVGVGWGLWHVPRDVTSGVIERLGWLDYTFLFLPAFVSGTVVVSVLAGYFVNRCGGSVVPAILVHGLANDAIGLSGAAPMEVALTPAYQVTKTLPMAVLAAALLLRSGRRLGLPARRTPST